jgi:hypothetical protein
VDGPHGEEGVTMTRQSPAPKPIKVPEENNLTIPISAKNEAEAKKRIAGLGLWPEVNAARLTCALNPQSSLGLMEAAGKQSMSGPRTTATCRGPRRCCSIRRTRCKRCS